MKDGMLEIKDAPMFGRVMRDPDICKGVLECILGISIQRIEYLNTEQTFDPATDAKGVRMDVFAKGNGRVFDIEMQVAEDLDLDRRLRYYQASVDQARLDKGQDYDLLDESYIIFICDIDPYRRGLPIYHIERICEEDDSVDVADASHWIVLNASAWEKDIDAKRSSLLHYMHTNCFDDDTLVSRMSKAVRDANEDAKWRKTAMGFMTVEQDHRVRMRQAVKRGVREGEDRYASLVDHLLEQKRFDDLKRSADDADFRQKLFEEFHIA